MSQNCLYGKETKQTHENWHQNCRGIRCSPGSGSMTGNILHCSYLVSLKSKCSKLFFNTCTTSPTAVHQVFERNFYLYGNWLRTEQAWGLCGHNFCGAVARQNAGLWPEKTFQDSNVNTGLDQPWLHGQGRWGQGIPILPYTVINFSCWCVLDKMKRKGSIFFCRDMVLGQILLCFLFQLCQ